MEFIDNLDEKEYSDFTINNISTHFMKSYSWGTVCASKNFIAHYVGLKDNGRLVCAALLLEKRLIMNYTYFYSPRGYTIDYKNKNILELFTKELKKYVKEKKGIFIKIDPDIKRHDLDIEGNVIGNINNNDIIESLKDIGYHHQGFNKEFTASQPRFTFRLDLTKGLEEIQKNMHATTRKILNKGNQYDFEILRNDNADINDFYYTMVETAKREHIACSSLEYYKNFYETLHKNNMSDLYVLKLNISNLKKIYYDKINEIDSKINEIDNNDKANISKSENRKKDLNIQKEKINEELEEIDKIKEEQIILSSIITVKYADKVWTVHGGNSSILRELNANYYLYYKIIELSIEEGYKVIDFFGCSGDANPDKSSSIYGLHNFKKRLGGEYTEFIGEFDLITNKPMYLIFKILIPIRRKIANWKLRNG